MPVESSAVYSTPENRERLAKVAAIAQAQERQAAQLRERVIALVNASTHFVTQFASSRSNQKGRRARLFLKRRLQQCQQAPSLGQCSPATPQACWCLHTSFLQAQQMCCACQRRRRHHPGCRSTAASRHCRHTSSTTRLASPQAAWQRAGACKHQQWQRSRQHCQ